MKLFKELFESNLKLLCSECELSENDILKGTTENAYDCRFILIVIAKEYKCTNTQISEFSGFSLPQIGRAYSQYNERMKKFNVSLLMKKIRDNTAKLLDNYHQS